MTIKTQNGNIITKEGKVSCECCEPSCAFDSFAGFWGDGNFEYNTFEITREEYIAFSQSEVIEFNVAISHFEEVGDISDIGADFSFNISTTVTSSNQEFGGCVKLYESLIPFTGTFRYKLEDEDLVEEEVESDFYIVMGLFLSNEDGYKIHYEFRMRQEFETESRYTDSNYFIEPIDTSLLTGHPDPLSVEVDGNSLNTPKLYVGLSYDPFGIGGSWYEDPSYNSDISVGIQITTITT